MDRETKEMMETLEAKLTEVQRSMIALLVKSGMTEEEAWREHDRLYAEVYLERLQEQWREKQGK